jgi:hypothetical protein
MDEQVKGKMKISIHNIYTDETENFTGDPQQIHNQLKMRYPFLRNKNNTLQQDVEYLAAQQAFMVNLE